LRPFSRFAPSYPRSGPPTPVVFADWLSITAALASGVRPSATRTRVRSASCARRSVPLTRQRRNRAYTVGHGGNSRGSMRHAQPERST
jgi:hypothetical protein